jgi:5-methylthioribose kinase
MREIDADSAIEYLRDTGRVDLAQYVAVRELAGGVSNVVLLVQVDGCDAFVLKQARGQLRVALPWFCSVERIWREVDTLRRCGEVLARRKPLSGNDELSASVPQVLFEDRANYLYAMSAAPPHTVWKTALLAGQVDPAIAVACGRLLGALHGGTWRNAEVAAQLDDRQFFDALRIDPYYRRIAEVHPQLREPINRLIESQDENRLCLVHGDFSPKNLLLHEHGQTLVDFEVGHYGDPAFDLGFFLTHLVLKAVYARADGERYLQLTTEFWNAYRRELASDASPDELQELEARAVQNFAGCALARIDGKSPVEYLTDDSQRDAVRCFTAALLRDPPSTWTDSLDVVRRHR